MLRIDFFVSRRDLSRVKCDASKNRLLRPTTVVQLLVPLTSNRQKLKKKNKQKKNFAPLSRDFLTDNTTHRAFIQPMGALWNQSQIHDWCSFLILATSVISNCLTVPAVSLRVNVSMFFKVREPLESLQQSESRVIKSFSFPMTSCLEDSGCWVECLAQKQYVSL